MLELSESDYEIECNPILKFFIVLTLDILKIVIFITIIIIISIIHRCLSC
jgi:hypothetical protein